MNRRDFLAATTATSALAVAPGFSQSVNQVAEQKMGITIASYMQRWRRRGTADSGRPPWNDAIDVLNHCQDLGAGCLQIGVAKWTEEFAGKVRDRRESLGVHLEGQVRLPRSDNDTEKFERDVCSAKEAGVTVLRTVCLGGRRYESFDSLEQWNAFKTESKTALERAEPILARHGMKMGFENHKDWRAEEHVELLQHLDSEFIGATFDFGNNFALLENPYEVAEALAPYLVTTHVKDMGLAEYEGGFLLSEVPMGSGVLDLKRLIEICRKGNPDVWFNLEMITRDPLRVPVLSGEYWATMDFIPATELSEILAIARPGQAEDLPRTSGLEWAEEMALEERFIRESFDYARAELGFA